MTEPLPLRKPPLSRDTGRVQAIHQWPVYEQGDFWAVYGADGEWIADFKTEKDAMEFVEKMKGYSA